MFKAKQKIESLGDYNAIFEQKICFFENFLNFSVEAEKLIFQTKWVILAPKQLAKFLTDFIEVLFINLVNF